MRKKNLQSRYIWRTVGDSKVRDSHASREGQIFTWGFPPPGGHPGEDYNCRCWAESIVFKSEYPKPFHILTQTLTSPVNDAPRKWGTADFLLHFYRGSGKEVALSETGYLRSVIDKAEDIMFWKVADQVAAQAQQQGPGNLTYATENSYPELGSVFWVFGGGTIRTYTKANIVESNGFLLLSGIVQYEYEDMFTDIASIRQSKYLYGTSSPKDINPSVVKITDIGGVYFKITGNWMTRITGTLRSASQGNN